MKRIEYSFVDKSAWGDGPWHNEPDKVQWRDEATGLPCLILRNGMGAWCGYVGVSKTHPAFKKEYDEVEEVTVHGGLTFTDKCQHLDVNGHTTHSTICHIVEQGEDDNVWWLGFDCSHLWDLNPASDFKLDGIYRDQAYVTAEVLRLARQLKETSA